MRKSLLGRFPWGREEDPEARIIPDLNETGTGDRQREKVGVSRETLSRGKEPRGLFRP